VSPYKRVILADPILSVRDLTVRFGGIVALDGV
jgi:ABC-type branched-subunit amino acid transport system ATPase component